VEEGINGFFNGVGIVARGDDDAEPRPFPREGRIRLFKYANPAEEKYYEKGGTPCQTKEDAINGDYPIANAHVMLFWPSNLFIRPS